MEIVTVSQGEVTRKLIVLADRRPRDTNSGIKPGKPQRVQGPRRDPAPLVYALDGGWSR
jgi:hypothetical protein